jgi:hypothetical protein
MSELTINQLINPLINLSQRFFCFSWLSRVDDRKVVGENKNGRNKLLNRSINPRKMSMFLSRFVVAVFVYLFYCGKKGVCLILASSRKESFSFMFRFLVS